MPRPKRARKVGFLPEVTYFKPAGVSLVSLNEVILGVDELEAIRLADLEGIDQVEAAGKMKVSQSTFQRVISSAHKKTAQALVCGRAIKIEGGEINMPFGFGRGGRGRGRGQGGGRMGGPFAAGPGGSCVCTNPDCGHAMVHVAGQPCYQVKCPKCGSPMIRKA